MKIQIEKNEDLTVLEKVLAELGLAYSYEETDHSVSGISPEALNSIQEGLKDLHDGRVLSHGEAMERVDSKIAQMRAKYASRV
nr:hypothetical protein [uncultured Dyadobacter sp.]